jgi:hypothetical protein
VVPDHDLERTELKRGKLQKIMAVARTYIADEMKLSRYSDSELVLLRLVDKRETVSYRLKRNVIPHIDPLSRSSDL